MIPLDEMVTDFDKMLFNLHLFCGFNEVELTRLDEWFNSPGLDLC